MTTVSPPPTVAAPARGRLFFWAGIGLAVLGMVLNVLQFFALKLLIVPWYLPVLTTLGALLLLVSVVQRRTIVRLLALGLLAVFAGSQWFFLVSLAKLPAYEGPVQVGHKLPAFRTTKADGMLFTERYLESGGAPTILVFFRGRW
jgi:hypothetical protein